MTTLKREIRTKIMDLIREEWVDISTHEGQLCLADAIAFAVLEIVNKKKSEPLKPTNDPMWNFLHGIDMTQEEIDDNKLLIEAVGSFERDMNFGALPWSSTQAWTKFQKFVVDEYKKDKLIFAKYKTWQQNEGKYTALSNRKIRENPQVFIDCFPDFLAHSTMYGSQDKPESSVDDDGNIYV